MIKILFLILLLGTIPTYAVELTCQGVKKEFDTDTKFILLSTTCPHCHLFVKKPENQDAILLFKEISPTEIKKYLQKNQLANLNCLIPKNLRKSFSRLETPKIIDFSSLN